MQEQGEHVLLRNNLFGKLVECFAEKVGGPEPCWGACLASLELPIECEYLTVVGQVGGREEVGNLTEHKAEPVLEPVKNAHGTDGRGSRFGGGVWHRTLDEMHRDRVRPPEVERLPVRKNVKVRVVVAGGHASAAHRRSYVNSSHHTRLRSSTSSGLICQTAQFLCRPSDCAARIAKPRIVQADRAPSLFTLQNK